MLLLSVGSAGLAFLAHGLLHLLHHVLTAAAQGIERVALLVNGLTAIGFAE